MHKLVIESRKAQSSASGGLGLRLLKVFSKSRAETSIGSKNETPGSQDGCPHGRLLEFGDRIWSFLFGASSWGHAAQFYLEDFGL